MHDPVKNTCEQIVLDVKSEYEDDVLNKPKKVGEECLKNIN